MNYFKTLIAFGIVSFVLPADAGEPRQSTQQSVWGLWGGDIPDAVMRDWTPDLAAFQKQLEALVRRFFPDCVVKYENNSLTFQCDTRKFWIHKPYKDGGWQDAQQEIGPNPKGIYCKITPREGNLRFQSVVPQKVNRHYYVDYWMQPHSPKLDGSLLTLLRYPRDVDPDFVTEFQSLLNQFDKFVITPTDSK